MRALLLSLAFIAFTGQLFAQDLKPGNQEALANVIITDLTRKIPETGAKIEIREDKTANILRGTTDSVGRFSLILEQGKKYDIAVIQYDLRFDFGVKEIPNVGGPLNFDMKLAIGIDTIYGNIYTLKNVYFETDKATLKSSSNRSLDSLYNVLKHNPDLIVEIAGHTDNEGSESYNLRLSQKRAQAVRDYILDKGISEKRVKAKGYGEHDPIADNNTEEGKAKNRRTEVRIIKE